MCQNATKTAASLMAAIEPTLKSLLTVTGQINTPEGQAAIKAYDAALVAVQNWQSGTAAQTVLELVQAFQGVFNAIPLPAQFTVLGNIILAGIETVIGVISANSPAPKAAAGVEAIEEPQAVHQAVVAHETVVKVHSLVPGIKLSRFHSADSQYKSTWNKAVDENGLPGELKS